MVELKQVYDEDTNAEYVVNHSKYYSIVDECRGVREKFWMVMEPSRFNKRKEPMSTTHILFKSSRNDVSCENWGEVYASILGKQGDIPVVDYYMATLDHDGKKTPGVMCGSYFKTGKEIELNAYNIHVINSILHGNKKDYYDNAGINTIEGMLQDLQAIPDQEFYSENIKFVRQELYKQAIFDFLLAQTDRHWFNTTFLISFNPVTEKACVIKAPCYDNGCIAMLKRKASAIVGISQEIENTGGADSPYLETQLNKYCPMMGIKTPLVHAEKSRKTGEEDVLVVDDPVKGREIFLDELCRVIADDPDLSAFYINLKNNLNISQVTEQLMRNGDNPPESVSNIIKNVVGHQIHELDAHMRKVTAKLSEERGGLSE